MVGCCHPWRLPPASDRPANTRADAQRRPAGCVAMAHMGSGTVVTRGSQSRKRRRVLNRIRPVITGLFIDDRIPYDEDAVVWNTFGLVPTRVSPVLAPTPRSSRHASDLGVIGPPPLDLGLQTDGRVRRALGSPRSADGAQLGCGGRSRRHRADAGRFQLGDHENPRTRKSQDTHPIPPSTSLPPPRPPEATSQDL